LGIAGVSGGGLDGGGGSGAGVDGCCGSGVGFGAGAGVSPMGPGVVGCCPLPPDPPPPQADSNRHAAINGNTLFIEDTLDLN
jgi:hypothetical protein